MLLIVIWPLWFPLRFWLLLQGEGTYKRKLDIITFPFSSSNRGTQRCNGRITPAKQNPLDVPNHRLPYKLVDKHLIIGLRSPFDQLLMDIPKVESALMKYQETHPSVWLWCGQFCLKTHHKAIARLTVTLYHSHKEVLLIFLAARKKLKAWNIFHKGLFERNGREKWFPQEESLIWPPAKSMIFSLALI